jgi:hypothetical protein
LSVLVALALFSACTTDESGEFLTVGNKTNVPLVVFAFPDGALVDLVLHLEPGSFADNMIMPGHHLGFDNVPGYQAGKGVFLAVYVVVQSQGADLAVTRTVTDAELKLFRGQVTIDALPMPRL